MGGAMVLRYVACGLMLLVGVLGGAFAAGEAFADLETPQAIGSTVPWLVIAVALVLLALFGRRFAPWVFMALTAVTAVRAPVESALGLAERDDPFAAIWVLVLAVGIGFLGLRHARLAAVLLAVLAVAQMVVLLVDEDRGGASVGELLGTSSGVVVVPLVVVALLFAVSSAVAPRQRHEDAPLTRA